MWDIYILITNKLTCGVSNVGTKYDLDFKTPNKSGQNFKSGQDMIDMYKELCAGTCYSLILWCELSVSHHILIISYSFSLPIDYPIVSIEDPFDKEDWEHVKYFSSLGICQVCLDSSWRFAHVINISLDELPPIHIHL